MVSKFGQAKDKCKTKTSNKNLKELVPSILPLIKHKQKPATTNKGIQGQAMLIVAVVIGF